MRIGEAHFFFIFSALEDYGLGSDSIFRFVS